MGFTINIKMTIPEQRIKDLLCNALESGSNYWYQIQKYINPNKIKVAYKFLDLPFIDGCGVVIGDIENDFKPVLLNKEAISKGLQVMSEKYTAHMQNFINDNDDADTGDVFLQCCLFGDVIFS
jgi:hypothetical protein